MLREWEAVVLRTVQEYGRVYVKQLPKLLAENPFVSEKINESRSLQTLEEQGYLYSRFAKNPESGRQVRFYRITKNGERALQAYQKHLRSLARFLERPLIELVSRRDT